MKRAAFLILTYIFLNSTFSILSQPRIWNIDKLNKEKAIATDASRLIIKEANKQLPITIPSVMDKNMAPPSGDKHDYWSMGRYWWPDPNKKDGLPYIRKDGLVNKEIDKLDRIPLSNLAKSVIALSLAYHLTSEEKYASKAISNLKLWFVNKETKMNPNMNYGQTIPGRKEGQGRGEGIIDTYSFIEMLDGIELLEASPRFKENDKLAIKKWFSDYLDWLLTSSVAKEEFDSKNNHGTAYDVQVTRYALFVGKTDIAKRFINEFPNRRIFTQIEPDGTQPLELARTTAMGYSLFNLTHILDMCKIAKTENIDLFHLKSADGRSILKAIEYLAQFLGKPKSAFPYKQIKEWDKAQENLYWVLYRADSFSGNNYYTTLINKSQVTAEKDLHLILY